jgi:hypothetical protein
MITRGTYVPVGFSTLVTFNGFWPSKIGGFYLGGGIGFTYGSGFESIPIGFNIGYKFVTKSGLYYRTGAFAGFNLFGLLFDNWDEPVYFKPDLAIGWTMR